MCRFSVGTFAHQPLRHVAHSGAVMGASGWGCGAVLVGALLGAGLVVAVASGLVVARALPGDRPVLILSSTCGPSVQVAEDPRVIDLVREGRVDVRVTDGTAGPPLERCAEAVGWPGVGRRLCVALAPRVHEALADEVPGAPVPVLRLPGEAPVVGAEEIAAALATW